MGELMTKYVFYERHKEVIADTKKYINEIAQRYRESYSYCMFKDQRNRLISDSKTESLLMEQRKWENFMRPLFSGYIHILCSNQKKWSRVYCVLQPTYLLEIYRSEEAFKLAGKPLFSIRHGIYDIVENVDAHLMQLVKDYLRDFGYIVCNALQLCHKVGSVYNPDNRPTQHVLSLYHKYRGSIYIAFESALERDQWLDYLQDAQRQLAGVHCEDAIQRQAFEIAIKQICKAEEHCNLRVKISGTQNEIVADFITAYLSNGCKAMLQTKIKGNMVKKFKMWSDLSKGLSQCVQELVNEDYETLRRNAETEIAELVEHMKSSFTEIGHSYDSVSKIVVDDLEENWHEELQSRILPKIPKLVEGTNSKMLELMREVENVFVSVIDGIECNMNSTVTQFANNIDIFFVDRLDVAPRTPETMRGVFALAVGSNSVLKDLRDAFPKSQTQVYEDKLCILSQKLLDSAIATFEVSIGDIVLKSNGCLEKSVVTDVKATVIKQYTHDSIACTKQFVADTVLSIVRRLLQPFENQDLKLKMDRYKDAIQKEFHPILTAECVFSDAINEHIVKLLHESFGKNLDQCLNGNGKLGEKKNSEAEDQQSSSSNSENRRDESEGDQSNATQDSDEDINEDPYNYTGPCGPSLQQDKETGECVEESEVADMSSL